VNKEPAAIVATATAIVSAVLVFLKSMGLDITEDQQNAIRGLVAVVAPLVAGIIIRNYVVSPAAAGEAVGIAKTISPSSPTIPEIRGVSGFKDAAADAAGVSKSAVDWRPPVDAH
jgi:hypothetical protein